MYCESDKQCKRRKVTNPLILLSLLAIVIAVSACALKQDKIPSVLNKAVVVLYQLKPVSGASFDLIVSLMDLFDSSDQKTRQTVTAALEQKDMLQKTNIILSPQRHTSNAEILGPASFILHGAQKTTPDALVYFAAQDGNNKLLRNVLIEADFTVEKLGDDSPNGSQTIAIGVRGKPHKSRFWQGYSFQVLTDGIMKLNNEAYDDRIACQNDKISRIELKKKYHMILAVNGHSANIALVDYGTLPYQLPCDLSLINMDGEGEFVYLYAWNADVKFTNVSITAL